MDALAAMIVENLDAADARGGRVLLVVGQGTFLPASWTRDCTTYTLTTPRFTGTSCVPWDARYQEHLRSALIDVIGPAVRGHRALAGVYFTISTMTNGSEMHFRAARSTLPGYPGDADLGQAYRDVMDIYQAAFDVPILFEGGHCLFTDAPADCETPLELYRHTRDVWGLANVGVAAWDCAERFFVDTSSPEYGARTLLEEASADGANVGCQTVGAFTDGACQFTAANVADYGTAPSGGSSTCPSPATLDPEDACVDTMNWFVGRSSRNPSSATLRGTWAELWSQDVAPGGIYRSSAPCAAAVDALVR